MKKLRFIILSSLIFAHTININAQDYQVGFVAHGIVTVVDSVQVENISQNKTISVLGSDILHLLETTNIGNTSVNNSELMIYPNPAESCVYIEFYSDKQVGACIEIYDLTGKLVAKHNSIVYAGINNFKLDGISKGMYIINVNSPDFNHSANFISIGSDKNNITIENFSFRPIAELPQNKLKNSKSIVPWQYNEGDILIFKAFSDGHSRINVYYISANITLSFYFVLCQDIDENKYTVVSIGGKNYMAENLRTSKYNNGVLIPNVKDNTEWADLTTGGRCYYSNDSIMHAEKIGALYNFAAVNTGNLCPTGWHVPTVEEFQDLLIYLQNTVYNYDGSVDSDNDHSTNDKTAKSLSSRSEWTSSSEIGVPGNTDYPNYRNRSGFNAMPAGMRSHSIGHTSNKGILSIFWSSTSSTPTVASTLRLFYDSSNTNISGSSDKIFGYSVRCVMD